MASILVMGSYATVELTTDVDDGTVIATCVGHRPAMLTSLRPGACDWTATYDDMDDATEYSTDHADKGEKR